MAVEILPLISFVLVTTFTPGPNNISSASMGVLHGHRKTLSYLFGIASGFFIVMIICAMLSSSLLAIIPTAEKYLRWVGAAYIMWLAWGIIKADYGFSESNGATKAYTKGFLLQLFNPKGVVYGLTLYTTFLAPIAGEYSLLLISAVVFAGTAFLATSTWALCGAAIANRLKNQLFRRITNGVLAVLLVYTAVNLAGII